MFGRTFVAAAVAGVTLASGEFTTQDTPTATNPVDVPGDEAKVDAAPDGEAPPNASPDGDADPADGGGLPPAAAEPPKPKIRKDVPLAPFKKPDGSGLLFYDLFESLDKWVQVASERFTGVWETAKRKDEAIEGDLGLKTPEMNKFYAISRTIPTVDNAADEKEISISFEVKAEDGWLCSGAYIKAFNADNIALSGWNDTHPYAIMFGPDKCGFTDKVHLIIQHKNEVTGKMVEHHLNNPPMVPHSPGKTHAFTLRIMPNDTYEILIDGESARKGKLAEDFEPPFSPPEMIDDPTDTKPSDWVDHARMPDPAAVKPEDWDEDEPMTLPDEAAVKPEGWLDDEPASIVDRAAVKPESWDDEEDGTWEPPMKPNPACAEAPGCGPWTQPEIPNPKYKGPWSPPDIDNPDYRGPWEPKKMANPEHFVKKTPYKMFTAINALGFDIWVTDPALMFDNVAVSRDFEAMKKFLDETFKVRQKVEDLQLTEEAEEAGHRHPHHSARYLKEFILGKPMISLPILCLLLAALAFFAPKLLRIVLPLGKKPPATKEEKKNAKKTSAPASPSKAGAKGARDDSDTGTTSTTPKARQRVARPNQAD